LLPIAADVSHVVAAKLVDEHRADVDALEHKVALSILPIPFFMDGMLRRSVAIPAWRQRASTDASRRRRRRRSRSRREFNQRSMISWAHLVLPVCFLQEWIWSRS
jgi:hypothetical protein